MIAYFIKLVLRKFQSNLVLFTGSIITVSVGALCISLMFSYVYNELSTNRYHKRANDIYMMVAQISAESQLEPFTPSRFSNFNYKDYPEIESLVSVTKCQPVQVKVPPYETTFSPQVLIADSTFLSIFDFKLLVGNKKTVLHDPGSAIITEDFARKLFGDKNPIGKQIEVTTNEVKTYTIQGIAKKVPSNSSIVFDIVLSNLQGHTGGGVGIDFILVNGKFNKKEFSKKIENLGISYFKESKLSIIPFKDFYFFDNPNFLFQVFFSHFGDKKTVYTLSVIILIVFLITALNFCGYQVFQINKEIKTIGISKIMGIKVKDLFIQKTVEILLLVVLSSLVVTIVYAEVLPYFNKFAKVSLSPSVWEIIILNFIIIVALFALAMIYPAIITSKIPVTDSIKGKVLTGNFLISQKTLVTIQYTLTIVATISFLAIFRQVSFLLNKDVGFNSKNVIRAGLYKDDPFSRNDQDLEKKANRQRNYEYILNELASMPSVEAFAQGDGPLNPPMMMSWKLKGSEKDYMSLGGYSVQSGYLKVLGLKLMEGRFFDSEKDAPGRNKIVINEAAKRYWGIKNIHDSRLQTNPNDVTGSEIIGVVKDFNYAHLSVKPGPLVIGYGQHNGMPFLIKFREGFLQEGLQSVSKLFRSVYPGENLNYTFLSEDVAALSQKEKLLSRIYFLFTLISMIMTTLGIFVTAMHDARQRTKEIGIRKVNGARNLEIMYIFNKGFIKLVFIALIIACPIAWYTMHKWLQSFAYKIELSWWIFAIAGGIALLIALLTISWQSWRAATRNPVESLRYE